MSDLTRFAQQILALERAYDGLHQFHDTMMGWLVAHILDGHTIPYPSRPVNDAIELIKAGRVQISFGSDGLHVSVLVKDGSGHAQYKDAATWADF